MHRSDSRAELDICILEAVVLGVLSWELILFVDRSEIRMFEIPEEALATYTSIRTMPDGQVCGVKPLVFHWTVHVDLDNVGYRDRWCFQTEDQANTALAAWDGVGDMPGDWHKHPASGRHRNPETGAVWKDGEIEPGSIAGMAR